MVFVKPSGGEFHAVMKLLHTFGQATGLHANWAKSAALPISCEGMAIMEEIAQIGYPGASFPITYLGMPFPTGA